MGNNIEPNETPKRRAGAPSAGRIMRNVFGIFMVLIYVGMGILLFINFFGFDRAFAWVRWVGGSLFILYGIWRGYRQAKGLDSNYYDD